MIDRLRTAGLMLEEYERQMVQLAASMCLAETILNEEGWAGAADSVLSMRLELQTRVKRLDDIANQIRAVADPEI